MIENSFWKNKRVFITGHTGFKGAWLTIWLTKLDAKVMGYALESPTQPSLFDKANLSTHIPTVFSDVCDIKELRKQLKAFEPDIVFHLAAQSLVRYSYQSPIETYETNVMGSLNLLEVIRDTSSVKSVVMVTTDKCYENKEWVWSYRENEPVGGKDPYSSSKACTEIITASYRDSFFQDESSPGIATARAGNVIGGGDWAKDRLIPDIIRSVEQKSELVIRNPNHIRPWQHVLEPLKGYMLLAEKLYNDKDLFSEAWNFGPSDSSIMTVGEIVTSFNQHLPSEVKYQPMSESGMHEASTLRLDSSKARVRLGWEPKWDMNQTIQKIVDWHQANQEGQDLFDFCVEQIDAYTSEMK